MIETTEIATAFLKQLERKAAMFDALERGGVDNWDYYYDSLRDAGLCDDEDEEEDD